MKIACTVKYVYIGLIFLAVQSNIITILLIQLQLAFNGRTRLFTDNGK